MSKVRVTTHEFPKVFSDLVLHELDPRYSRETVKVASDVGALPFGAILARRSDGLYEPLKEVSGTLGDAKAVLISQGGLPASNESQEALVLRGYCIINATNVQFDASVTKKADALTALNDRGFIVKEVPEDVA